MAVTAPGASGPVTITSGSGDVLNLAAQIGALLSSISDPYLNIDTDNSGGTIPDELAPGGETTTELVLSGGTPFNSSIPEGVNYAILDRNSASDTLSGSNVAIVANSAGGLFNVSGNSTVAATGGNNTITASGTYLISTGLVGGNNNISVNGAGTVATGGGQNTIVAGGNTSIKGGSGTDYISITGANDTVVGGSGAETVSTNSNTMLFGGTGPISFVGGAGTPTIIGTNGGSEQITVGGGGLRFSSGPSNASTIQGGAGITTLFGGANSIENFVGNLAGAMFTAGGGNETLNAAGSAAPVTLSGGSASGSNVSLVGGSGNDALSAGRGSDTLTGNGGNNSFIFSASATDGGHDYITDFNSNDSISLLGYDPLMTAATLERQATVGPDGVTVTLSDSTEITFTNLTSVAQLSGFTVTPGAYGPPGQYNIADDSGTLYMQDTAPGPQGAGDLPGVQVVQLAGGIGVFDHTGAAEDVARLYGAAFGRAPDLGGLEAWTAAINDGDASITTVANAFVASPEFQQDYGSISDTAFVDRMYEDVLGRAPDAAGEQNWDAFLAAGGTEGQVLVGFAESAEYKAATISTAGDVNNAEVYRIYQTALDRAPDPTGDAYWTSLLANGTTPTQVAQDIVASPEFQHDYGSLTAGEFVSSMYENLFHRAGDPAGLQAWTNALQNGASRADVVLGFADSLENRLQTAGATHANWVFIPNS